MDGLFIKFDNYSVYYGAFEAVSGFSVDVDGGIIGLLGPNGAGKTTLIKGILGLQANTSGDIEIYSQNTRNKEMRRDIGFMAEDDTLITGITGLNFVSYMGLLTGMERVEAIKRAHEVIGYIGMGEMRYRPVDTYSKGNMQKIKLAAALVHDPKCLFLDEPTSGLDPKGRIEIMGLIRELGKMDKDIIISSHLIDEIEKICDKIMLIQDGKLKRYEKIKDLKQKGSLIYEMRVIGDKAKFIRVTDDIKGIRTIKQNNNNFIINTDDEFDKAQLFQKCLEHNIEIRLFVPSEHTLQDAIMDIIDNDK